MKMRLPSFLAGMLTMALVASLSVGALAASGAFTITVNPVSVQVNGQTFQPKDANGKDVPVFNYDGTTYAPLRALAEAYGLTVGWDQDAQMATVGEASAPPDAPLPTDYSDWSEEDEAAYQEFKGLWEIKLDQSGDVKYSLNGTPSNIRWENYTLTEIGSLSRSDFVAILEHAKNSGYIKRLAYELKSQGVVRIEMCFLSHDGEAFPRVIE